MEELEIKTEMDIQNDAKYHIMVNSSHKKMIESVNKAIEKGWRPQGGITTSVHPKSGDLFYIQAMVKVK